MVKPHLNVKDKLNMSSNDENERLQDYSTKRNDKYQMQKLSSSNRFNVEHSSYANCSPERAMYRNEDNPNKLYYKSSKKYKKDKSHDYEGRYREWRYHKGRYYKERKYPEEHHRSSSRVSSKKHRYEKESLKNTSEPSNKHYIEDNEYYNYITSKRHKSTLSVHVENNADVDVMSEAIGVNQLEEIYVESLINTRNPNVETEDINNSPSNKEVENAGSPQSNKSLKTVSRESTPGFEEPNFDTKTDSPKLEFSTEIDTDQETEDVNIDDLPPYYPAIQGCRSVTEFRILNHINEGTYGIVYRAIDKKQKDIVALKRLKMEKEKEGFPITSLREINTLLKGQHQNIVTVREIVVGNTMDKIFIVMDFVEHDVKSLIEIMRNKNQSFTAGEIKCLLKQLLCAIAYLHDNWILHRDLKTSNLLLSRNGILKVGDFGLAREYGSPLKAYTPIVVTLWYRAPELLLFTKQYSTPIDVWSVGCIFGEFALMNAIFQGRSEIDQLNKMFKILGTPTESNWQGFNKIRASQRIKLAQYPTSKLSLKFHMLTGQGQTLLQQLLTYDPKQRITAEDAFRHPYFNEFPLPIDPSMFPPWPSKHDPLKSTTTETKQIEDAANNSLGFHMSASTMDSRKLPVGGGFNLKF